MDSRAESVDVKDINLPEQGHRERRAVKRDGVPHQVERHVRCRDRARRHSPPRALCTTMDKGEVGWNAAFHGWKAQNQGKHDARDADVVFGVRWSTEDDTDDTLPSRVAA